MPSETSESAKTLSTRELARFVVNLRRERIPNDQFAYAGTSLLDWLGCCLAGVHEPPVQALEAVIAPMGGAPQSTIVGRGRRSSTLNAALLNGAAGNILDLDDVHPGLIGHPSAVLAPAALALGEWLGRNGSDVGTAYVAGYEVMVRLGLGVEPQLYEHGWHATGVLGVFGACACAAKMLELTEIELESAMAIAASQAAGLRSLTGTPSRCIHQGKAAMGGILASLWAQAGVQSCRDVVGDRHGLRVFGGVVRTDPMLEGLGEKLLIDQTCYKRHAASGSVHAAVDAAITLRETGNFAIADIERIEVRTHPLAFELSGRRADPGSTFEAKQSLHFSVALAFKEGRCDMDLYTDAMLGDVQIRRLRECISVVADATMEYDQAMPSDVSVTTRDGRRLSLRVDTPRGRPGNPMSRGEIIAKFGSLSARSIDARARDEVIDSLATLDDSDVRTLMGLVREPRGSTASTHADVLAQVDGS